jgi:tetratricopeptide (TPR) repeat protein
MSATGKRVLVLCLAALLMPAAPLTAAQDDPRLPALFERLRTAQSEIEAVPIEALIWSIWSESADPESARLLQDGIGAMGRRAFPEAIDAFSAATRRQPSFAEAWNKRATVYYLIGDDRASVADIQRTLTLEPHHFGALSGLGLIYLRIGEPEAAIRSFEAALKIHPHLPGARAHIEMLKDEREGDPT